MYTTSCLYTSYCCSYDWPMKILNYLSTSTTLLCCIHKLFLKILYSPFIDQFPSKLAKYSTDKSLLSWENSLNPMYVTYLDTTTNNWYLFHCLFFSYLYLDAFCSLVEQPVQFKFISFGETKTNTNINTIWMSFLVNAPSFFSCFISKTINESHVTIGKIRHFNHLKII